MTMAAAAAEVLLLLLLLRRRRRRRRCGQVRRRLWRDARQGPLTAARGAGCRGGPWVSVWRSCLVLNF